MSLFWQWVIVIWGIWYFFLRNRKPSKTASLKVAPTFIEPINAPDENLYDLTPYTIEIPELPELEDTLLAINRDSKKLRLYAEELDRHKNRMESAANDSIQKFHDDYMKLDDQQLQIYRRVYQSKTIIKRFKELKYQKISAKDIPEKLRVPLPPIPSYLDAKAFNKKYSVNVTGISNATSKAILNNGGLKNANNVWVAAIGLAAVAVADLINTSKMKRKLEEVRGQIINHGVTLKTRTEALKKSHSQIVDVSYKLKQSEISLIMIIDQVKMIDKKIKKLEDVSSENRSNIGMLYYLASEAEMNCLKKI